MRKPVIVDVGAQFGLSCGRVFDSWNPILYRPTGINQFEQLAKEKVDLVVFGGGSDIHPILYGHAVTHSHVSSNKEMSTRDMIEVQLWKTAQKYKIPILGICRGAQLACALSGGALIQTARGHAGGDHTIFTVDGKELQMSSAHHQMMVPLATKHELIAWAKNLSEGRAGYDLDKLGVIPDEFYEKEPEIIYFPDTHTLAVQGHPEFMSTESRAVKYTKELLIEKFFKDNKEIQFGGMLND